MNLDQFMANVLATNDGYVDVDKVFGPQCWDLVELYAEQVLSIPKEPWSVTLGPHQSAYEAWTVFDSHMQKYFDKIPVGQQQRGDINVYNAKPGYPDGHICIELGNNQVFQQNATKEGSPSHTEFRGTSYFLGSLRSKGHNMQPITPQELNDMTGMMWGVNPADPNHHANWDGKPFHDVYVATYQDPRTFEYADKCYKAIHGVLPDATVLKPGNYQVK